MTVYENSILTLVPPNSAVGTTPEQKPSRILVIVPAQPEREQMCQLLAHCGYSTQTASSVEEGLKYLTSACQEEPRFAACILVLNLDTTDESAAHESATIASVISDIETLSATECRLPVLVMAREDDILEDALSAAGAYAFLPRATLNEATLKRALRYALSRHRVERDLRTKASHQNAIAETTPLVIVTINEDDVIEYVNPAVRAMLGYEPEDVLGRSLTNFMSPADAIRHREGIKRYLKTGERRLNWQTIEVDAIASDGRLVPVEVTFSEYRLSGHRHFAAALRDVSEQRQAQEALRQSEARYAQIAHNVPGMIYQFVLRPDNSSYFPFVGQGIRQIFGVSPEQAYQSSEFMHQSVHPDDREEFFRLAYESRDRVKTWHWIGRIVRADGQLRWAEVHSHPTRQDNGDLVYDGMMLDVTSRINAEIELNQAHLELEDRVEQRTQELAHANATLQAHIEQRLRIEAAIRRHARQQEALAQLSQSALTDIELPILLRGAVALVAATMDVHFGNISLLDAHQEHWLAPYAVGWEPEIVEHLWPVEEDSALYQVWKTGIPLAIDDWQNQKQWTLSQRARDAGVVSTVYVRIPGAQDGEDIQPYGVLAAHSNSPRHFSIDDIQFLQAMANIIATTVQRRQLNAKLLETSQRLQAVLDNASAIIFIKDLEHRYVLANKRLEEFHHLRFPGAPPLLGSCDTDFMRLADAENLVSSDLRIISEKQHHTYEVGIAHCSGTQHFLITKFPLFDEQGKISGIGGVATDITERKGSELAREASRQEAEAARQEADRANRAKSEFLSRMSHELRTPLNAIIGFGQLLERSELPPRSQQGVEQILRAGRHLLNLINEVLDMASIEAGRLSITIQVTHARSILEEVLDLLAPLAAENQVSLQLQDTTACDAPILADPQRFRQILLNLISNAIKYNQPGGTVTVSCQHSGAPSQPKLQIRVRDNGQGIAPENMARLWQPFDRLNAGEHAIEGTGLGLALSLKLAQGMNGTLDAISTPDEGSTFWLELPRAPTRPLECD